MVYPIESTEKVAVGKAVVNVQVNCRAFLIKNNSDSAKVYFGETKDGAEVPAESGFALAPGETCPVPLRAHTLTLIATGDADVRLLYIGEGW